MITDDPDVFLREFARLKPHAPATAKRAFLVRPPAFSLASESTRDNVYMAVDEGMDTERAAAQHRALEQALQADVPVDVFPGDTQTPDAIFPNNAFATTSGRFIVGRMCHPVRQRETGNAAVREHFAGGSRALHDLSGRDGLVAELTGALIVDRARNVGFAGLSGRCDAAGAEAMHEAFGLDLTYRFRLAGSEYHTNVVMALLASRAVILAPGGFADSATVEAIAEAYEGRCLRLDDSQKNAFAGNAITLSEGRVWMSARGAASLCASQRKQLADWGFELSGVQLDEIEKAGGSLRCCVAEVF